MPNEMRVTLVAPPVDFLRELYGFRAKRSYRNQPPLGIGYLASTLAADGFAVTLIDCAAEGLSLTEATQRVLATSAAVIGVTAITFEAPAAFALIRALRSRTDAWLVFGGAHANSYLHEVPAQCPEIDVVVAGDGELTMRDLCRRRRGGQSPAGIPGLLYRLPDGSFTSFVERPLIADLDDLPPPAYHLYPHACYRPLPHRAKRLPSSSMITSRGCSYARCTYCELSGLVRKVYRRHSPERVADEMKTVMAVAGARDIYFQDDIFITDAAWVERFCERIIDERLDIAWSCESRFQGVTLDLLRLMRRAGCWRIYYGFESGNQHLLDRIRKGFTLAEAREAARVANDAGLEIMGFFMLGLPGETPADAERTIDFSLQLGLDHAVYTLTVPHPNTELYELCRYEGVIAERPGYFYKKASFVPFGYRDAAQLEGLSRRAFRRFYLRPAYWWRCLRRIRSFEDLAYYARGFLALFSFLERR